MIKTSFRIYIEILLLLVHVVILCPKSSSLTVRSFMETLFLPPTLIPRSNRIYLILSSILSPALPAKYTALVVYRARLAAPKHHRRPGRLPSTPYAADPPIHAPFGAACPFALPTWLHHRRRLSRLAVILALR